MDDGRPLMKVGGESGETEGGKFRAKVQRSVLWLDGVSVLRLFFSLPGTTKFVLRGALGAFVLG